MLRHIVVLTCLLGSSAGAQTTTPKDATGPARKAELVLHVMPPEGFKGAYWLDKGATLLAVGREELVWWDADTGKEKKRVAVPKGHEFGAVSPRGTYILGGPKVLPGNGYIGVFTLDGFQLVSKLEKPTRVISTVGSPSFSWDERLIAWGDQDSHLYVWESASGNLVAHGVQPHTKIGRVAYTELSPDGRVLTWMAHNDPAVHLWDVVLGCSIRDTPRLGGGKGPVVDFLPYVSRPQKWEAGALKVGESVVFWERYSGLVRGQIKMPKHAGTARWPDGRVYLADPPEELPPPLIASPTYGGISRADFRLVGGYEVPGHGHAIHFAPDGRKFYAFRGDSFRQLAVVRLNPVLLDPDRLSDKQLQEYWDNLGSDDGNAVLRAVHGLIAAPDQALALIKAKWPTEAPPDDRVVQKHLRQLKDGTAEQQRVATRQLTDLGEAIRGALHRAYLEAGDNEAFRSRVRQIGIDLANRPVSGKVFRRARAVEILAHIDTPASTDLLKAIAAEHPWDLAGRMAGTVIDSPYRVNTRK